MLLSKLSRPSGAALLLAGMSGPVYAEGVHGPARSNSHDGWLYLESAAIPADGHVIATTRETFTSPGSGAVRPFTSDIAHVGAVREMGAETGLTPSLSFWMMGENLQDFSDRARGSGLMLGIKWMVPWVARVGVVTTVSMGSIQELAGASGIWSRVSVRSESGRYRMGATLHAERIFAPGRDDVDVTVLAGASYRVAGPLRLGVESVAQDLEEISEQEAEQGMRLVAGPTLALELADRSLWVGAGPGFGLSSSSPSTLGRVSIVYGF